MSASAACGGGGNKSSSSSQQTSSTPVVYNNNARPSGPQGSFDASFFHNVSGQLHMSGEQAAGVIRALQEIRSTLGAAPAPKDFDARKEFEKKLATILNPQQFKTYQDATGTKA